MLNQDRGTLLYLSIYESDTAEPSKVVRILGTHLAGIVVGSDSTPRLMPDSVVWDPREESTEPGVSGVDTNGIVSEAFHRGPVARVGVSVSYPDGTFKRHGGRSRRPGHGPVGQRADPSPPRDRPRRLVDRLGLTKQPRRAHLARHPGRRACVRRPRYRPLLSAGAISTGTVLVIAYTWSATT